MQDITKALTDGSPRQRPMRQTLQDRLREEEEPLDRAARQATPTRQQDQSRPGPSPEQRTPPRSSSDQHDQSRPGPSPEQRTPPRWGPAQKVRSPMQASDLARLVDQCESHVTLLMTHLLKVGPFYFKIPPPPDGIRWPHLIQRLEACITSCEQCAQQAIHEKRAAKVARQSTSLQEAARILSDLRPLAARLPPSLLVQNPERLQLRPGPRLPPAQVRELIEAAAQPPTNSEIERTYAGIPDLPRGTRGYTALVKELEELGIIRPPEPLEAVAPPKSKQAWQSTLDALETKLMDYAAGLERQQPPMEHGEYTERFRAVVRLRGWIVAARSQHAGSTKRGFYYRPQC